MKVKLIITISDDNYVTVCNTRFEPITSQPVKNHNDELIYDYMRLLKYNGCYVIVNENGNYGQVKILKAYMDRLEFEDPCVNDSRFISEFNIIRYTNTNFHDSYTLIDELRKNYTDDSSEHNSIDLEHLYDLCKTMHVNKIRVHCANCFGVQPYTTKVVIPENCTLKYFKSLIKSAGKTREW